MLTGFCGFINHDILIADSTRQILGDFYCKTRNIFIPLRDRLIIHSNKKRHEV